MRITRERVGRLERTIEEFVPARSLEPLVRALQALRGIDLIVDVTFATDVGDVSRFESPRQLMSYLGAWCQASDRPERPSGVAASPKPVTAVSATCWSRAPRPIGTLAAVMPGRKEEAIPARADITDGAGDRIEGAEPPDGPLPEPGWTRQANESGLHGHRS